MTQSTCVTELPQRTINTSSVCRCEHLAHSHQLYTHIQGELTTTNNTHLLTEPSAHTYQWIKHMVKYVCACAWERSSPATISASSCLFYSHSFWVLHLAPCMCIMTRTRRCWRLQLPPLPSVCMKNTKICAYPSLILVIIVSAAGILIS